MKKSKNKKNKKILVFDFDGTIADSKKLYVDTIKNSLLKASYIYPKSTIIKALGPKLEASLLNIQKFDRKTLKKLSKEINNFVIKKAESLKLCPFVKQELKRLRRSKKYKIILLTNSVKTFALAFLKKNKILNDFDLILGSEDFMNKPKELRDLARKFKVKMKEIIYIGDKKIDYKISKKVGCEVVLPYACSWDKSKIKAKEYSKVRIKNLSLIEKVI